VADRLDINQRPLKKVQFRLRSSKAKSVTTGIPFKYFED